jgi:hypothetical protein
MLLLYCATATVLSSTRYYCTTDLDRPTTYVLQCIVCFVPVRYFEGYQDTPVKSIVKRARKADLLTCTVVL